jgi:hypothetical protein
MTEQRPQQDQQPTPENQDNLIPKTPQEVTQPQETEVTTATTDGSKPMEQKAKVAHETKERGGNHNPKGANQYTSGRVDDRGRKS